MLQNILMNSQVDVGNHMDYLRMVGCSMTEDARWGVRRERWLSLQQQR